MLSVVPCLHEYHSRLIPNTKGSMTKNGFWESIDSLLRQYDLSQHPFYIAWIKGELSRDDLREYALEYYHHVASFPRYLNEFARRLPAGELRYQVTKTSAMRKDLAASINAHTRFCG